MEAALERKGDLLQGGSNEGQVHRISCDGLQEAISHAGLESTPRDALAHESARSALDFLLPSVPPHDPSARRRVSDAWEGATQLRSAAPSSQENHLGVPSILRRTSERRGNHSLSSPISTAVTYSEEDLLEELQESDMEELEEDGIMNPDARYASEYLLDDSVGSSLENLHSAELARVCEKELLVRLRYEASKCERRCADQSDFKKDVLALVNGLDAALDTSGAAASKALPELQAFVSAMEISKTQASARGDLEFWKSALAVLALLQQTFSSENSTTSVEGRDRFEPSTSAHTVPLISLGNHAHSKAQLKSAIVPTSPTVTHCELRNPFFEEATPHRTPRSSFESGRKMQSMPTKLSRILKTLHDRPGIFTNEELGCVLGLRRSLNERQQPRVQQDSPSRRSASPRSFSSPLARSRRSSGSVSPILRASDALVGDPSGEASAAGIGLVPTHTSGSRRASLTFLPTPGSHQTQRSSGNDSTHSRRGQSPPPRYSTESMRSWVGATLAATAAPEKEASDEKKELDAGTKRRTSSSSEMSWSLASAGHPPAYVSDMGHRFGNLRKGSSTSSLLTQEQRSAKHRVFSTPSDCAGGRVILNSTEELNMVKTSIDRLYEATPRLDDQCAGPATKSKTRASVSHQQQAQEDEFQTLMDQMTRLDRMNDQRVPLQTFSISAGTNGAATFESSKEIREATAELPGTKPTISPRSRRFPSVSTLSFASQRMRRAASFLERANVASIGKGKGRELNSDTTTRGTQKTISTRLEDAASVPSSKAADRDDERHFTVNGANAGAHDDDFFNSISRSNMKSRMANQDATYKPCLPLSPNVLLANHQVQEPSDAPDEAQDSSEQDCGRISGHMPDLPSGELLPRKRSKISTELSADSQSDDSAKSHAVKTSFVEDDEQSNSSDLRYIAEVQTQLGFVSILLWAHMGDQELGELLEYTVESTGQTLSVMCRAGIKNGEISRFTLPVQVEARNSTSTVRADRQDGTSIWSFRLAAASSVSFASELVASHYPSPFSAKDLRERNTRSLVCRNCESVISDLRDSEKFVQLPSQHWEELVDAWMCHTDQELNRSVVQAQKNLAEHTGLSQGQVHVSESDIFVDRTTLNSVKELEGFLHCSACFARIGRAKTSSAVQLQKCAISTRDGLSRVKSLPIGAFVAHDLIRLAQTHATRRFIITSDEDCTENPIRLSLWLFLEWSFIAVDPWKHLSSLRSINSFKSKNQDGLTTLLKGVSKVLYQDLSLQSASIIETVDSHQQAWPLIGSAETILYPHRVCAELLSTLTAINRCYPPQQRSMMGGTWQTGFLPLG